MRPLFVPPLALALIAATASCTTARVRSDFSRNARPAAAAARVAPTEHSILRVDSRHWTDVTVYAVRDGIRKRLGVVTAATTAMFRIPPQLLNLHGELQLIADPDGPADPIVMELILMKPGSRAEWTLESGLQRSSLGVW